MSYARTTQALRSTESACRPSRWKYLARAQQRDDKRRAAVSQSVSQSVLKSIQGLASARRISMQQGGRGSGEGQRREVAIDNSSAAGDRHWGTTHPGRVVAADTHLPGHGAHTDSHVERAQLGLAANACIVCCRAWWSTACVTQKSKQADQAFSMLQMPAPSVLGAAR